MKIRLDSFSRGLFCKIAFASSCVANAQYTVTILHPATFYDTLGYASSDGAQVGYGYSIAAGSAHAILWNGTSQSAVDLNPAGFYESYAKSASGTMQCGYGHLTTIDQLHALIWSGTASSAVDINPAGYTESYANGVAGSNQIGYALNLFAGIGYRAILWNSSAGSAVSLQPAGFEFSIGYGISPTSQVGWAKDTLITAYRDHAFLWTGSAASAVDLHPAGYTESKAFGTSGPGLQVGNGLPSQPGSSEHALLWRGTANSVVDLNPSGYESSIARSIAGDLQVGSGSLPAGWPHAMIWRGTGDTAIDLNPVGYQGSVAESISANGDIVGTGYPNDVRQEALLWRKVNRTISGNVSFGGGRVQQSIVIQLRDADTLSNVGQAITVPVNANGQYSFLPPGVVRAFSVTVLVPGFLRRSINANVTLGSVSNANLNLVPGNIVPDTAIDLSDYTKLVVYFNRSSIWLGWNVPDADGIRPSEADLNGDGIVDLSDYTLLVVNFNAVADN